MGGGAPVSSVSFVIVRVNQGNHVGDSDGYSVIIKTEEFMTDARLSAAGYMFCA